MKEAKPNERWVDSIRMDWLEAHWEVSKDGDLLQKPVSELSPFKQSKVSIREAIDNAMNKKDKQ